MSKNPVADRATEGRVRFARLLAVCGTLLAAVPSSVPPASAEPSSTLAVLPIKLLDTSGEPRDQSAEHRQRLDAMAAELSHDLATAGPYRTRPLAPADLRAACTEETPDCLLAVARACGADLVFVGVVHKSSTLIMQMWARIVRAGDGRVLFSRELNFRGDNDESWRRAEAFLIDQVRAAPPRAGE